ncbi:hypothetical protein [Chengkuizengella sediminis]|nr:hypothetical protein [Chengkuizengella sediminis]NDI34647.1 hypothetical protein [Chengkuizengella sediminis]
MSKHSSATGAAIVLVLFILLVIILVGSWGYKDDLKGAFFRVLLGAA